MSLFGVLRLRLSQETAPNSAQDDEFNDENNFWDRALERVYMRDGTVWWEAA
jgi:hypothetical protein